MSFSVHGLQVSRGVTIGRAVLLASARLDVAHYFVETDDRAREVDRLRDARAQVLRELEDFKKELPADTPHEVAALIDVHKMLLEDDDIAGQTIAWIRERRYNAEWALTTQLDVITRQFDEMDDDYLRERKYDVEQVVERLLRALQGTSNRLAQLTPMKDGAGEAGLILVAHDIAPADMLQFKQGLFKGFVTDTGGATSHTAIVARSLDIPAVVAAREATRLIKQDDLLIIDADAGVVIADPSETLLKEYRAKQATHAAQVTALKKLKQRRAVTLDGVPIELCANIEMPQDTEGALAAGAEGIGLFRSEFLFMNRSVLPDEEEQYEAYAAAVKSMKGRPVTIRTIDIGSDKPLDSSELVTAPNPALGLRAIRYSLSQPKMFRVQLRALLRASLLGPVRILVPMVAHASEITQLAGQLAQARAELAQRGDEYARLPAVPVGAMIEIPAAALMLPLFVKSFDFLSLGTNDLIQYTLAIDRADESVAHLYDPLHPAVLRLIADTIAAGAAAGKPVSLCGEMAGETRYTKLLLAMGLRSFSMHPSEVARVKSEVLHSDAHKLQATWRELARDRIEEAIESLVFAQTKTH